MALKFFRHRFCRSLLGLTFVALSQLQLACVAFRGSDLKDEIDTTLPPITTKISINFSNQTLLRDSKGQDSYVENRNIVEGFMLSRSGFFLTTQSLPGEEDLHLRFKTLSTLADQSFLRQGALGLYRGLSMISLGIIPYFEWVPRRLEVEVVHGGKAIKKYNYADSVLLTTSLFLLPWWRITSKDDYWYNEGATTQEVDANIVKHFLLDLHRDFMPKPQAASKPSQASGKAPQQHPQSKPQTKQP